MKKWMIAAIGGIAFLGIGAATPLGSTMVWQTLKNMINSDGKFTKIDFADGTSQTTASSGSGSGDMLKSTYDVANNGVVDSTDELPTIATVTTSLAVGTTTNCPANVNFNSVGTSTIDRLLVGTNTIPLDCRNNIAGTSSVERLRFLDGTIATSTSSFGGGSGDMSKSTYDTGNNSVVDSTDELPTIATVTTSLAVGTTTNCPANVNFNSVGTSTIDRLLVGTSTVPLDCRNNLAGTSSVERIRFSGDGTIATSTSSFGGGVTDYGALTGTPTTVTQTEAEGGTSTTDRSWTALRVYQAIDANSDIIIRDEGATQSASCRILDIVGAGIAATTNGSISTLTVGATSVNVGANKNCAYGTSSGTSIKGTDTYYFDELTKTLFVSNLTVSTSTSFPAGTETINGDHTLNFGTNTYRIRAGTINIGSTTAGVGGNSGTVNLIGKVNVNDVDITNSNKLFASFTGPATATTNADDIIWTVTIPAGILGTQTIMQYDAIYTGTSTGNANRGFRITISDGTTLTTLAQSTMTTTQICYGIDHLYKDIGTKQIQIPSGSNIINGSFNAPLYTTYNWTANTATVTFLASNGTVATALEDANIWIWKKGL